MKLTSKKYWITRFPTLILLLIFIFLRGEGILPDGAYTVAVVLLFLVFWYFDAKVQQNKN
ncbi:hypothetical protein Apar_0902 [Lancefieldella parvula DSM 20469]|uniref:Uncharacterized protein n=1 Tax=Lancefieldella parvula (strain ATCC 33793 / DSM 20469 / CCUG 32760 / JCM 10300 / KCTC 3663 / VPI 0546 / 1246) TaxID=521095 RepID=C8W792_LANP1|nr:hypothetical protein Apar_0902 [Lancefieldella parvula DSM 20469]